MKTIGSKLEPFEIVGVKLGFSNHEENGELAFKNITEISFPGKWGTILFYPRDFIFICPTETIALAKLNGDFADRDTIMLGGSTDSEFVELTWRHGHKGLNELDQWSLVDSMGALIDQLGVHEYGVGVTLRAMFITDPDNVIQHVSVNNLNVGRNPDKVLRIFDGLQTDELCSRSRAIGGVML